MKATPVLAAMGSILFALMVFALWRETHEWEAVIFAVISVAVVVVTTVWAVVTVLRGNPRDKEGGE